ncbi:Proteasome-activating nucleotidase [Candidatus Tiddalikarchaeum anstoanum]|nr:Proteasome-activating nucleotidase [Candidatus Tiddalikarchaeum anstoanum]
MPVKVGQLPKSDLKKIEKSLKMPNDGENFSFFTNINVKFNNLCKIRDSGLSRTEEEGSVYYYFANFDIRSKSYNKVEKKEYCITDGKVWTDSNNNSLLLYSNMYFLPNENVSDTLPVFFKNIEDILNLNSINKHKDVRVKPTLNVFNTLKERFCNKNETLNLNFESNNKLTFEDVGGCYKAKDELKLIAGALNNKELYKQLAGELTKGIILYGPPGCGKTLLAKAFANEIKAEFQLVKLSDLTGKYYGDEERNVNALFDKVSSIKDKYVVMVFDEIDSFLPSRRMDIHEATHKLVSTFLARLDGVQALSNVLIFGTTNMINYVDEAIKRPGRLDTLIEIELPDEKAREEIFNICLKNKKHSVIDTKHLSSITKDYSGADIEYVVKNAGKKVFKEYLKTNSTGCSLDKGSNINFVNAQVGQKDVLISENDIFFAINEKKKTNCDKEVKTSYT